MSNREKIFSSIFLKAYRINEVGELKKDNNITQEILNVFFEELESDRIIRNIQSILNQKLEYLPTPVEILLEEAIAKLDTCLARKSDLVRYEKDIISSCMNYLSSLARRKAEDKLLSEEMVRMKKGILSKQFKLKTSIIAGQVYSTLPDSEKEVEEAEIAVNEVARVVNKEIRGYEDTVFDYFITSDSAVNIVSQYYNLKCLFEEDLYSVLRIIKSILPGVATVYTLNYQLPELTKSGYIENLYTLLTKISNDISYITRHEIQSTFLVSVKDGVLPSDSVMNPEKPRFIVCKFGGEFSTQVSNGVVYIEIPIGMFEPWYKNVRIRNIRFFYSNISGPDKKRDLLNDSFNVTVGFPNQSITGREEKWEVPPMRFTMQNIVAIGKDEISTVRSRQILNINIINDLTVLYIESQSILGSKRADEIKDIIVLLDIAYHM